MKRVPFSDAPIAMQVRNYIRAGFGVEDIHVKTGIHLDTIRFVVRQMRASGELAAMFKSLKTRGDAVK